jgi:peptidyl-prolyl cis-trans isomerase D
MLRGMRKASSNWLGKVVMAAVVGFLVISFAIWGIGDIFRGFGRSTFAKIGNTEIQIETFRQLYNERLRVLSNQLGRQLTLDQARQLGLDRQIVGQLIAEIVLDERARALRLGVTDAEISRRITSDPGFRGLTGQFDRATFEAMIRQAGFTEARFVAEQRRQLVRRQLGGTVVNGSVVPKAMIEAADRYQNEQRSIEYVLIDRAQAGTVELPSAEVLAEYFNERKILFRAPEYRKVVVVPLIPSEQARWVEVSDADLKKAYDERRSRYVTPERRTLQQIVFPNADEARAASERIVMGAKFTEIATERGLTEKDIDLGTLTRAAMLDRAVADAAFALKEDEVSMPVQGRFGTVIVHVVKIEPEKAPTFEEIAPELRKDIATERAKAEMLSIYDKIEDERSLGHSLAEAAEKLKFATRTVEFDRSGRDMAGNPIADLPDAQRLLSSSFNADIGVENDPLQVEGGYVWYEVAGITPARERTLEEVKERVEARWLDEELTKRLQTKAKELMDKLKAGTSLTDAVAADGLKVETKAAIKRGENAAPFSANTTEVIFRTAKDAYASADAAQPGEQIVFRVTDIVIPSADLASIESKRLQDTLTRTFADDIYAEFIAKLEDEIGVNINQAGLRQVVTGSGATADDDNN